MPREKYHGDGKNEYSPAKEKPIRWDLRKRHERIIDDKVVQEDKKLEKEDMKLSEELIEIKKDKEFELAKKIAKHRIKQGKFTINNLI